MLVSPQRAQSLNLPSGSVDGEGQRCGEGSLGFDGVRELGIQCPFLIVIKGHQQSHLAAWNQEYQSSQTKGVCQSLLRLNIIHNIINIPPSLLTLNPTVVVTSFLSKASMHLIRYPIVYLGNSCRGTLLLHCALEEVKLKDVMTRHTYQSMCLKPCAFNTGALSKCLFDI